MEESVPPPDVMLHAPVDALPPTEAPDSVIEEGLADSQASRSAPGLTVAAWSVTTVVEAVVEHPLPFSVTVTSYVYEPTAGGVTDKVCPVDVVGFQTCVYTPVPAPPPETADA